MKNITIHLDTKTFWPNLFLALFCSLFIETNLINRRTGEVYCTFRYFKGIEGLLLPAGVDRAIAIHKDYVAEEEKIRRFKSYTNQGL